MNHTIPQPPEGGQPPEPISDEALRSWMYQVNRDLGMSASSHSHLEARVTALEETLISRRARRRLRRIIREADKAYAWAGRTFAHRRFEACAADEAIWGEEGGEVIGGPAVERPERIARRGRHGGDQ